MIISHALKTIFLKTKKTGGTSFEIALSKFCAEHDVITPISPEDEKLRQNLGFRGPQNYSNTVWVRNIGGNTIRFGQTQGDFRNHIPAAFVRGMVPPEIWENYLILSIIRSPYDVAISRYFWEGGEKTGLSFEEFILKFPGILKENYMITHIEDRPAVQQFIRYENFEEDTKRLEQKTGANGLWEVFKDIKAKSNIRPKKGTEPELLFSQSPKARQVVEAECRFELDTFGYRLSAT